MYYGNKDIRIEQAPVPAIGRGELLVRIEASGICGSDVMEWYRINRIPLVLGHEIAGTIVEAGEGLTHYKKGMRVSVSHHVPCGRCSYCQSGHETVCDTLRKTNFDPGGFCEYVRIPEINVSSCGVYLIPDDVSFEEATFIEPLACVLRGQRLAGMKKGLSVLVVGSGIAGILHIHLARFLGARRVFATDVNPFRLELARRFGAEQSFHAAEFTAERLREANDGRLADLVIICTGSGAAMAQGFDALERAATALFFAPTEKDALLPLPVNNLFWRNERTFVSSYAGSPQDHREALELISSRKLDVKGMITHRLPLSRTQEGFDLVSSAGESLKVIIEPQK